MNIVQALQLPEAPARGMEQAFSCLYFLAKQRIPHTSNFEPLLDLLTILGVNVKTDIRVAKNATYTSHKSIQDMVFCLSDMLETHILKAMKEPDHFSLRVLGHGNGGGYYGMLH